MLKRFRDAKENITERDKESYDKLIKDLEEREEVNQTLKED